MLVTVSTALLFALVTGALVYFNRVTVGAALMVWLSGFTAAATGLAGPVNDLLAALVAAVGQK